MQPSTSAGSESSLGHLPQTEKWEFDASVTACFEDMLRRSIPQYDVMRAAVTDLARAYAVDGTEIVDLGSSRGDAIAPLVNDLYGCRFRLVEVSGPMLDVLRERFTEQSNVRVEEWDLRRPAKSLVHLREHEKASVVTSVLTLQFTPIEHRQRIVQECHDRLLPGGALILVEKILGNTARLNEQMVDVYHRFKVSNGYTPSEVERKRLSLEGVLVPVTARWNEELLRSAGFVEVDCFWRWMNFAAWVAVKR